MLVYRIKHNDIMMCAVYYATNAIKKQAPDARLRYNKDEARIEAHRLAAVFQERLDKMNADIPQKTNNRREVR